MSTTLCYLLRPDGVPRCSWQQHFLCFLGYRELRLSVSPALPFCSSASSPCCLFLCLCRRLCFLPQYHSVSIQFSPCISLSYHYYRQCVRKIHKQPAGTVRRVVIQRMKFSSSGDLFRLNITFSLQQLGNQHGSSGSASHSVVRQADELIVV